MSEASSDGSVVARRKRKSQNAETTADDDVLEEQDPPKNVLWMIRITEFSVMLYALSKTLVSLAAPQFVRYVLSRNYEDILNATTNLTVCSDNTSNPVFLLSTEIQKETSKTMLQLSITYNVPSMIMSLFLGAYSDYIGRKFLFLLPMCGCFIQSLAYAIVSYLKASLVYMYVAEFISGACGGFVTFLIACFSFTSDVTSAGKSRSFHIVVLECVGYFCTGLAMYGLGFMIKYVGFTVPFIIACMLTLIGVATIAGFVKNVKLRRTAPTPISRPKITELLYNTIQFYVSNRDGKRAIFLLAMAVTTMSMFVTMTVMSVMTVFLMGRPLCLDSVDIGQFTATMSIVSAFGTMVFVRIGQRWLGDVSVSIISSLSYLSLLVLVGLAHTKTQIYIGVGAGCLGIATAAMMRVVMSKLVTDGQHGALFAGSAFMEGLVNTIAATVGNGIYEATVSFMSGLVFFVMAGVNCLSIVTLIILSVFMKRQVPPERQRLLSNPDPIPSYIQNPQEPHPKA